MKEQAGKEAGGKALGHAGAIGGHRGGSVLWGRMRSAFSIALALTLAASTALPVMAEEAVGRSAEPVTVSAEEAVNPGAEPTAVMAKEAVCSSAEPVPFRAAPDEVVPAEQISGSTEEPGEGDRDAARAEADSQSGGNSTYTISMALLKPRKVEYTPNTVYTLQVLVNKTKENGVALGTAATSEEVAYGDEQYRFVNSREIIWLGSFGEKDVIEIPQDICGNGNAGRHTEITYYGYGTEVDNSNGGPPATEHSILKNMSTTVSDSDVSGICSYLTVPALPAGAPAGSTVDKWAVAMEIRENPDKGRAVYCSRLIFVPVNLYTIGFDKSSLHGSENTVPKEIFVKYFTWNDVVLMDANNISEGVIEHTPLQIEAPPDTPDNRFAGWRYRYGSETNMRNLLYNEDPAFYCLDPYGALDITGNLPSVRDQAHCNITLVAQWSACSVFVDQDSLDDYGAAKPATGIPTSFYPTDRSITITGIPEDTEQYTFDGWQYRFSDEEASVRHDVTPDEQGSYVIDVRGMYQDLYLYARWCKKVTAATLRLNDQEVDKISISNEIAKARTASLTEDCAVVKIELLPQPADAQETLTIEPDGTGFFGMGLTAEDAAKQVFAEKKLSLPGTAPGQDGKQTRVFYVAAAKSGYDDTPMNQWIAEGRRSGAVKLSVKNSVKELGTCTVCINGYDSLAEGYYENGALVKSTAESTESRQVAGQTVRFDTQGVRISGLTVAPAELYLPVGGAPATLEADGTEDDIIWSFPGKTGENELFRSAVAADKSRNGDSACMNLVTGTGTGSFTFTAQEKSFPRSSGKAQSVVSLFGLAGTITGSNTPAFGVEDAVGPGKWNTQLDYSTGDDGTVRADRMILTVSGGDVSGAPQTGTITLTSSDEQVVQAEPSTLTLTAAGPGKATVTLIYDNTKATQSAGAKVTLTLEVGVGDSSHADHHWVLKRKDTTWLFDWNGTTCEKATARASFRCTDGNETAVVDAAVGKGIENTLSPKEDQSAGRVIWRATIKDPAGRNTYTESCWFAVERSKNPDGTWTSWQADGPYHGLPGVEVCGGGFTLKGLEKEYPYAGAVIRPAFEVVDNSTGATLANGTDYSVTFFDNTKVGVATIKVKGKGNYSKSNAEATFKIVDPKTGMDEADLADLKGAKITAVIPMVFDYDGEAHFPETITLKLKGGSGVTYTGTDGENYVDAEGNALPAAVSFSGNVNKGTATVLLSGKNNAEGKATTVKKTFKINAVDLKRASTDDLTVTVAEETVAWEVKGAQPEVKVEYKGRELLAGQDYKVTYKNNKKVGTATVTIAGKGNYAKTRKDAASFAIEAFDLTGADIIATTAAAGVKVTKVKVTILDKAGNAIPAGKLEVTVEGAAGIKLAAGETVTVKAYAKGAELKESCSEEVTVQAENLSMARINVRISKTYTGEAIELDEEDMKGVTVTLFGTPLVYGEDFEIVGYSNNVNKGSMTVTIAGKDGRYCGSKTFKVKIEPKPLGTDT